MVIVAIACTAPRSGNPIVEGWYADPEAVIFGDTYSARQAETTDAPASMRFASTRRVTSYQ